MAILQLCKIQRHPTNFRSSQSIQTLFGPESTFFRPHLHTVELKESYSESSLVVKGYATTLGTFNPRDLTYSPQRSQDQKFNFLASESAALPLSGWPRTPAPVALERRGANWMSIMQPVIVMLVPWASKCYSIRSLKHNSNRIRRSNIIIP